MFNWYKKLGMNMQVYLSLNQNYGANPAAPC